MGLAPYPIVRRSCHAASTLNTMHVASDIPVKVLRQIALDADADPRTVERLLLGEPVRGRALRERILEAARLHNVSTEPFSKRGGTNQP